MNSFKLIILLIITCYNAYSLDYNSINLKNYLMGKFKPEYHPNFVKVSPIHSKYPNIYLIREVYYSFIEMANEAKKSNIKLYIVSGFRSFDDQKFIWERKWNSKNFFLNKGIDYYKLNNLNKARIILRYSSMPGTSRHHWGTEIDINSVDNDYFNTFEGKEVFCWLEKNAGKYGFARPYTQKNIYRKFGYEEEKWHWSYTNLSKKLLIDYTNIIRYSDICDFKGSEFAKMLDVIKFYVLGVDLSCK